RRQGGPLPPFPCTACTAHGACVLVGRMDGERRPNERRAAERLVAELANDRRQREVLRSWQRLLRAQGVAVDERTRELRAGLVTELARAWQAGLTDGPARFATMARALGRAAFDGGRSLVEAAGEPAALGRALFDVLEVDDGGARLVTDTVAAATAAVAD